MLDNKEIIISISKDVALPDNDQYTNRFNVRSSSSNNLYIVAQHKRNRHWACRCRGWIRWRRCQHLSSLGLPGNMIPFEARVDLK